MFIGNIKQDTIIPKIKLICVSFAPHSRIFLVVGFPQPERQCEIEQRL